MAARPAGWRWAKAAVHLLCLLPLALLLARLFELGDLRLGANPGLVIRDSLGTWGLRLLLATLAMTPLRLLTGRTWPLRFRRLLGLWAWTYVSLHFVTYFFFDRTPDLAVIAEDILRRPYITLGVIALLLLTPLAVTSTTGWQRRLGQRWAALHRLIYPATLLGCWHFAWLVKQDVREPLLYGVVFIILLGIRRWHPGGGSGRHGKAAMATVAGRPARGSPC